MAKKTKTVNLVALEDQPLGGAENMLKGGEVILSGDVPQGVSPEKLRQRVIQGRMAFQEAGTDDPEELGTMSPNGVDYSEWTVKDLKEFAAECEVQPEGRGKAGLIAALVASGVQPSPIDS